MPSTAETVESRKADLAQRLDQISEELSDLVIETLKAGVQQGQSDQIKAEEKLLARARRSVDKASGLLRSSTNSGG